MFKKIILHFWSIRHQFFRYFLVGFSGLFIDLGTFYILTDILHIRPVFSVMLNGILMLNYIFFLNKYWTFKSQGVTHKQMIRFFILAGFNYTISIGWMFIFNEKVGVHHLVARISNIIVSVAWNFILYKYWVYRHEHRSVLDTPPPPVI